MKRKMIILFLLVCLFITGKTHALVDEKEVEDALISQNLYDEKTQDIIIIETEYTISEKMLSKNYDNLEDQLKSHIMSYIVEINKKNIEKNSTYYSYNLETKKLTTEKATSNYINNQKNKVAILIIDKNSYYNIYTYDRSWYYDDITLYDSNNKQYNGYARPTPKDNLNNNGITDGITNLSYSFEWNMYNFMNLEFFIIDNNLKEINFPGFFEYDSNFTLKIEFRDEKGNIFLMPQDYFNNYGGKDEFIKMSEDGFMYIEIGGEKEFYGEIDYYFPIEYDYRISIVNCDKALGFPAYHTVWSDKTDEDGFISTEKGTYNNKDNDQWHEGQIAFAPLTKELRIYSKSLNKLEDYELEESFNIKYTLYNYGEEYNNEKWEYLERIHTIFPLYEYPIKIYDIKTNDFIRETKTDKNGNFTMKVGEYAVIQVWKLPDDFSEFKDSWISIGDIYDSLESFPIYSKYIISRTQQNYDKYFIEGSIGNNPIVLGVSYTLEKQENITFIYDLKDYHDKLNPDTKDLPIISLIILNILLLFTIINKMKKLKWLK